MMPINKKRRKQTPKDRSSRARKQQQPLEQWLDQCLEAALDKTDADVEVQMDAGTDRFRDYGQNTRLTRILRPPQPGQVQSPSLYAAIADTFKVESLALQSRHAVGGGGS